MRIGFLVDTLSRNWGGKTTFGIARRLLERGHEIRVATPGAFALDTDGSIRLLARGLVPGAKRYRSAQRLREALWADGARAEWIDARRLDALILRANPSRLEDWSAGAMLEFAWRLAEAGVVVLNEPQRLLRATSKLYLQDFPEQLRPRTLVTRSLARIERFLAREGRIVLKPLRGSGGQGVFLVGDAQRTNLKQIVASIARDGFVVAQEYLPAADAGDVRLFLVDGEPLVAKDRHAVARRVRPPDDFRSNVRAGGRAERAEMNDGLWRVAELVRPKLLADGMFFAGLDVAGDRLLEVNVFCPGGLHDVGVLQGVDFTRALARACERRITARRNAGS